MCSVLKHSKKFLKAIFKENVPFVTICPIIIVIEAIKLRVAKQLLPLQSVKEKKSLFIGVLSSLTLPLRLEQPSWLHGSQDPL